MKRHHAKPLVKNTAKIVVFGQIIKHSKKILHYDHEIQPKNTNFGR